MKQWILTISQVFIANTTLPSKNLIWHWGIYTELKEKWLSDGHLKVDNTKESIRWKKECRTESHSLNFAFWQNI
jgi:hypothetical protein